MLRSLAERDLEPGGCSRAAPHTGVHPPEPGVEHVLQLAQREVGDVDLAHLGDDDEALAVHVEGVRLLDVAGENQDQQITGTQAVVLVHRALSGPAGTGWSCAGTSRARTASVPAPGRRESSRPASRPGRSPPSAARRESSSCWSESDNTHQGVLHLQRVGFGLAQDAEGPNRVERALRPAAPGGCCRPRSGTRPACSRDIRRRGAGNAPDPASARSAAAVRGAARPGPAGCATCPAPGPARGSAGRAEPRPEPGPRAGA